MLILNIINMLKCLIDYIFAMFSGRVCQQRVGIPMGTTYATLPDDLFINSIEAAYIHGLLKKNKRTLALSFNFTISYIDDVLSLNHSKFGYFVLSDSYFNVHL
jgi:hypothetical protein